MDLIGELASKLGVDANAAQALAGTLLGGAQSQLADQVGDQEATQMAESIPELADWKAKAAALGAGAAESSGGGGLMGALGGALSAVSGEQDGGTLAAVTALLGKLNLSPSVIATIAPLVLGFLQERLPPELLDKVKSVAPFLSGAGLAGGLGSLFGG